MATIQELIVAIYYEDQSILEISETTEDTVLREVRCSKKNARPALEVELGAMASDIVIEVWPNAEASIGGGYPPPEYI